MKLMNIYNISNIFGNIHIFRKNMVLRWLTITKINGIKWMAMKETNFELKERTMQSQWKKNLGSPFNYNNKRIPKYQTYKMRIRDNVPCWIYVST
jgi:hypothetical protein